MTAVVKKPEGLDLLREPFADNQISTLPKPYKRDSAKGKCGECGGYHGLPAVHLSYVGHAAITDRLLAADPQWTWEPLAFSPDGLPAMDRNGGLWIRLTVCGVTRLGYGDADGKSGGNAVKEAIGDALRNASMRFGAALDLWHKGDLHAANEARNEQPASGEDFRAKHDALVKDTTSSSKRAERVKGEAAKATDAWTETVAQPPDTSVAAHRWYIGWAGRVASCPSLAQLKGLHGELSSERDAGHATGEMRTDGDALCAERAADLRQPAPESVPS